MENQEKKQKFLNSITLFKRVPVLPMSPTKVTEDDLASDSEDETGRHSDGSSIHIDDDMEVDQEIVTESDPVGTAPRPTQFWIIIEFNGQNTTVVKLQGGHNMSTATMNVAPEATRQTSRGKGKQK